MHSTNDNTDLNPLNQSTDIRRYDIENDIRLKRNAISEEGVSAAIKVRLNDSAKFGVMKQQNTSESANDMIFLNSDRQPIYIVQ